MDCLFFMRKCKTLSLFHPLNTGMLTKLIDKQIQAHNYNFKNLVIIYFDYSFIKYQNQEVAKLKDNIRK
jgi:hypothetical protein